MQPINDLSRRDNSLQWKFFPPKPPKSLSQLYRVNIAVPPRKAKIRSIGSVLKGAPHTSVRRRSTEITRSRLCPHDGDCKHEMRPIPFTFEGAAYEYRRRRRDTFLVNSTSSTVVGQCLWTTLPSLLRHFKPLSLARPLGHDSAAMRCRTPFINAATISLYDAKKRRYTY